MESKEVEPEISSIKVNFVQCGNTLGTTQEDEELELYLEFQTTEDAGPFYVIKTDGWSFDDVSEIEDLIKRVSKVFGKERAGSSIE